MGQPGQATGGAWRHARLALAVLAIEPRAVGGLWLRARPGPVRDCFLETLALLPRRLHRIHPGIGDEALLGGLDLAATLSAGEIVRTTSLLSGDTDVLLTMAERCPTRLAAHLGAARDADGPAVVLIDEGVDDEAPPGGLVERLGLFVSLDGIPRSDLADLGPDMAAIAAARERHGSLRCTSDQLEALVISAARLGLGSLRTPSLAARAAEAIAALCGRDRVTPDDLASAVALVFAHRAAPSPEDAATGPPDTPPPVDTQTGEEQAVEDHGEATPPEELLVEAARAALPPELLSTLSEGRAARAAKGSGGAGAKRRGNRRGRPLPSLPGRHDGQARIDLVATLRAAAPWQPLRRKIRPGRTGVHIRKTDFRVRRFEEPSDRLLIFTVDASGSAAMARLAETKGAIELLLGEAYARRDKVALIAFRGRDAETLLEPTRSLVQTKRRLQGLPGGGGTPLAAGLMAALDVSHRARARGMTPAIALLTDGRGNIALDGQANRAAAAADAERAARLVRASGVPSLVIDTAHRPQPALAILSNLLDATYLALPRADARRLTDAVRQSAI